MPITKENPLVHIEVSKLGRDGEYLGAIDVTHHELNEIGNHGYPSPVIGDAGHEFPSSVAFVIWARVNGGDDMGRVTSIIGDQPYQEDWYAYDWRIAEPSSCD